jgi:hypothetical protein
MKIRLKTFATGALLVGSAAAQKSTPQPRKPSPAAIKHARHRVQL